MKKLLFSFVWTALVLAVGSVQAQTVILNFETPAKSTVFQYFASSLAGQYTQVVANPSATGINTSAKVTKYIKPAVAQTWAGAFSDPNPSTAVVVVPGTLIKVKIRMNHIGNLAFKLEQSTSGQPDWIKIVSNTQVNTWQELTYNANLPSDEAPFQVPTGTYQKITVFFDFGSPGTGADVTSYFDDVIVSAYPPLAGTVTVTNVPCNGDNTGSATVNATGGSGTYNYQWSNGETDNSINNVVAGTYTVTITDDATGATITRTANITQPASALNISANTTDVACFGGSTGSIQLSTSGGSPGYTYNWENSTSHSPNRFNLPAGEYVATVTDTHGCTSTISEFVYEPSAPLAATATVTNASCGNANGSITLAVNGGTSPYTFNWGGGITSQNRTGLAAGTYTVTITDIAACTMSLTRTVTTSASTIIVAANTVNVPCFGAASGSIALTPGNGIAPYSYLWENGSTTQIRSNLPVGSYTVTVTDAANCTSTLTKTITQPTALGAATASTPVNCFGASTGSIFLNPNGGTPTYTYLWNDGSTAQNRSALAAGTYSATVTDANNCTTTASATITQPLAALSASTTASNVSCFGSSNGQINAAGAGGTSPFSYLWSTGGTTSFINNLPVGAYSVTVTDAQNCVSTATASVSQPSLLVCAATATAQSANNVNDGTASATPSGGTPVYQYSWSNGAQTQNIVNLAPGVYTVTITDANGCTTSQSATVGSVLCALSTTSSSTNSTCFGANNGTASVNVQNASGQIQYVWSNGGTTASIANLPPGAYSVQILDGAGCATASNVAITEPTQVSANASASPQTIVGMNNGSATANPSGGTPNFTYAWSNTETTASIQNLAPGTYTVTATDAHGCTATQSVTVASVQCSLAATISSSNNSCFGANNGTAAVAAQNPVGQLQYLWNNGSTNANIAALPAGEYSVQITDINGCTSTATVSISEPPVLAANATATPETALGLNNGTATANPSGGTSPYVFQWDNGQSTQTIQNLAPGSYAVSMTDANGCSAVETVTVNVFGCALQSSVNAQNVSCSGLANGSANVSLSGGAGPYTYAWSNGQTTATATNLAPGNYGATVTDQSGCQTTASVDITEPALLTAAISGQNNVVCQNAATGSATVAPQGGTMPFTFNWSNGANSQTATGLLPGNYTATVSDQNGCSATTSATITAADNVAPIITCPANIFQCHDKGTVTYTSLSASDNCGILGGTWDIVEGLPSGSIFPIGTTVVTYSFTDIAGNVGTCSFNVTIGQAAVVNNFEANGCFQTCEGSIVAAGITGGQSPHTYAWSNGQTGTSATQLCNANVGLTVTDNAGCTTQQTLNVTLPPALEAATTSVVDDKNSQNVGAINITASGGAAPYSFNWTKNGSPFATTEDLANLGAGTYAVVITDANGCVVSIENIEVKNLVNAAEPVWARDLKISPNPTFGQTQIQFAQPMLNELTISVLDISGKVLSETSVGHNPTTVDLDLTGLPAGIYSIRLRSERETSVRKLVIQR